MVKNVTYHSCMCVDNDPYDGDSTYKRTSGVVFEKEIEIIETRIGNIQDVIYFRANKMVLTTHKKIGTHFKKENIFLATVYATEKNTKSLLNAEALQTLQEALAEAGTDTMYDIFYKEGDVYLHFCEDGVETYVGDNSDGMGVLTNIVSVWDYFSEDELYETRLADGTVVIGVADEGPAYKYYHEYNMGRKEST